MSRKSREKYKLKAQQHKAVIELDIKRLQAKGIKSAIARGVSKGKGIAKVNAQVIQREHNKLSAPKSRFIAKVKSECQGTWKINPETLEIIERPKEYLRLNQSEVNVLKMVLNQKYL